MSRRTFLTSACTCVLLIASSTQVRSEEPRLSPGIWRAWLESPGGELPFGLELAREGDSWKATLINGENRIQVPHVSWDGKTLVLDITHYDSKITAALDVSSSRLEGEWKKRAKNGWTKLLFHAETSASHFPSPRFDLPPSRPHSKRIDVSGKWVADFSGSDQSYVAVFKQQNGIVTGTIMTPTGDYGHLAGNVWENRLRLSTFDGAHAFLFDAKLGADGTLKGDFWSRDTWHETWTAKRDPKATLPDAFKQTKWTGTGNLGDISFPDLNGSMRSLDDPAFRGKARILMIFGSWCPNCYDASKYLTELHARYGERGLSILGLAFELTDDPVRNAKQVKKYVKRHGIGYPILIAGMADKDKVAKALPVIDKLRSYPTTIFLDRNNNFRAIHTGFTGPATGEEYIKLRAKFESIIEELLDKG